MMPKRPPKRKVEKPSKPVAHSQALFHTKSHEIRTNFVRISYEFHATLYEFKQISSMSTPAFSLTPEYPPPPQCTPPCTQATGHKQQWFGVVSYSHIRFLRHRNRRSRVGRCCMSVRSHLLVRLAYLCTLMGPCPFCALLAASQPCAARLSSMVWLSTTTYTPSLSRRRLRPPLLRNMCFSLR